MNPHFGNPLNKFQPQQVPNAFAKRSNGGSNHPNRSADLREVFVGDLSFFCDEQALASLFHECVGNILDCRIVRNDQRTRSLLFGFVTLSDPREARECARLLNGHFFMGRTIRVATPETRHELSPPRDGFSMHVNFSSNFAFDDPQRVIPTEVFLRKVFVTFGSIVDIAVKDYVCNNELGIQEGYGFVSYERAEDLAQALQYCASVVVQGILLKCTPTHSLPHHHPNHSSHAVHLNGMQRPMSVHPFDDPFQPLPSQQSSDSRLVDPLNSVLQHPPVSSSSTIASASTHTTGASSNTGTSRYSFPPQSMTGNFAIPPTSSSVLGIDSLSTSSNLPSSISSVPHSAAASSTDKFWWLSN